MKIDYKAIVESAIDRLEEARSPSITPLAQHNAKGGFSGYANEATLAKHAHIFADVSKMFSKHGLDHDSEDVRRYLDTDAGRTIARAMNDGETSVEKAVKSRDTTHVDSMTRHVKASKQLGNNWDRKNLSILHRSRASLGLSETPENIGTELTDEEIDQAEENMEEAVEVSHDAYMASHGKKARDPGHHANWMIGVGHKNIDFDKHKEGEHYITHNGKLSDAIKKAKTAARTHKQHTVHVLP